MIRQDQKNFYYSRRDNLQLQEIKWFRLKIAATIIASVIGCLVLLLGVNQFYYDFLDLGYNKINSLQHENQVLQQKVIGLTSQMKGLETTLSQLNDQGNQLRLLVDLPKIDEESKVGGIGGAIVESDVNFTSEGVSQVLRSATETLQKMAGETRVQNQSYEQILKKYEFNKGYFSALPALKPMEGYYSIKGFGLRMHPVLGMFKTHEGLDIINDAGTPVVASGDGVVEVAGQSGGGYGIVVMINHGYGYQTLYAHLSRVFVREGYHVKRGEVIAKSGRTGLVTGPHLHYEVRYKGVRQNPVDFFLDDVTPQEYRTQVATR